MANGINLGIFSKFHDQGVKDAESGFGRLGGIIGGIGLAAGAAFAAAGAAALAFGASSLKAADEADRVTRSLELATKNSGAFGDSAASIDVATEALDKHSTKLAELSGIDDEVINKLKARWMSVPSIAATGVEGINKLAQVSADVAAGTGKDIETIGLMFTKVAGDNETALSKLNRAGIVITDSQKAIYQSMVDVGDEAGAQAFLIDALGAKYQGAAEAGASPFERLKVIFENLQETIGSAMLPAIEKLVPIFSEFVTNLTSSPEFQAFIEELGTAFQQLVDALLPLLPMFLDMITSLLPVVMDLITQLSPVVIDLVEAFAPLIPTLADMVEKLLPPLVELIDNLIGILIDNPDFLDSAIQGFKDMNKIVEPVAGFLGMIADFLGQIGNKKTVLDGLEARVRATQKAASIGVGTASPYLSYNGNWGQAAGGQMTHGGLSWVGERGPELLNLPTGSQVIPLGKIPSASGGATYNISVNAGMGADGAALGEQIVTAIRKYERTSGKVFAAA